MENKPVKLVNLDWPWKYENRAGSIILVSDEQFTRLANFPDEAVEKPAPWDEKPISLNDYCRQLAASGATKVHIAYDYFFGGGTRGLYPDMPEFQDNLKKMYDVAQRYGLGIEPSVLSPLELGVGYQARTGESGRWMQYGEGLRDPQTGRYSVMVWKHTQWVNNKGPLAVTLTGVRAFAFREKLIPGTVFFSVDPAEIHELPAPSIEEFPGTSPIHYGSPEVAASNAARQFQANRVRLYGEGGLPGVPEAETYERVLVVLSYSTVEMDYFSPAAGQFVNDLVTQYHERGITLEGVYSDEMHIQQDWIYHHHMDYGQFTVRYVSVGFERAFAAKYGAQYADFAPYLVYFTCHQHSFLATHEPKLPSQHVFGSSPEAIAATLLLRRNYYHFLEDAVVNLMIAGRDKLEGLQGIPMDAFYHSTWAESPTCDAWSVNGVQRDWSPDEHRRKYEYTPDFIWSNTIQQAAAACANYFSWNEFLTGGNNDVPEGGYADRDYYGRALACSLAALNRQPLASCGMWGMPGPIGDRMTAVSEVFGAGGHPIFRSVQDYAPRKIEVLFLYPQDLAAVEERFGSWMVQYGYANYITAEKLVEYGRVKDGMLVVKGHQYRAVCALYEPFPSAELAALLKEFVAGGGTVVWSSLPPLLDLDGRPVGDGLLADLFGARPGDRIPLLGLSFPGRQVSFSGALAGVAPMPVLSDFVVDRFFPVQPLDGAEIVAAVRTGGSSPAKTVGVRKGYPGGGQAIYLGFRPRDDQSASTGTEVRTWFEILNALGAYPGSQPGRVSDNPSVVSRTGPYVACAFPNGALAIAPHYSQQEEAWPGGFFRDEAVDRQVLVDNPVADDAIHLGKFRVGGQEVTYQGRHCLAWRRDGGKLTAFAGLDCTGITLDGQSWSWAAQPVSIAWHPLRSELSAPGFEGLHRVWVGNVGKVIIPLELAGTQGIEVWLGAYKPEAQRFNQQMSGLPVGLGLAQVPFNLTGGSLQLDIDESTRSHWLYVVRRTA